MNFLVSTIRQTAESFTGMTARQHFRYWALPISFVLATILMYYVGTPMMASIVAPAYNREFGLLENIQNLILLLLIYYSAKLFFTAGEAKLKLFFFGAFIFSTFIFLEEIDYGLHWIEYFRNTPEAERIVRRNFHNHGKNGGYIKFIANVFIGLVFVIAPYLSFLEKNRLLRLLTPSKKLLFTVLSIFIITNVAHAFALYGPKTNGALNSNYSEFEETVIYYMFLLYLLEIKKGLQPALK